MSVKILEEQVLAYKKLLDVKDAEIRALKEKAMPTQSVAGRQKHKLLYLYGKM